MTDSATEKATSHNIFVVGTYNTPGTDGLFSFSFDNTTGKASRLASLAIDNPSYLCFNPGTDIIYAVSELNNDNSTLSAISFDKQTGHFQLMNKSLLDGSPCYVTTNGKIVVTANYGGGTVNVLPLDDDGRLKVLSQTFTGSMEGPDTVRQSVPHMHCATFTPDGKNLMASDFSSDRILLFDVVNDGTSLQSAEDKNIELKPDTGTRHIIFDADDSHAYVIGELSGEITVLKHTDTGYKPVQRIECDPVHERASADIRLSPDGKHLYASNRRRNDGIAIFSVDELTGLLTYIGYQQTGNSPRTFALSPDGQFLLVACRDSNAVEVYRRDKDSGLLTLTDTITDLTKPVFVAFVP